MNEKLVNHQLAINMRIQQLESVSRGVCRAKEQSCSTSDSCCAYLSCSRVFPDRRMGGKCR